jgi:DUF1680 family protein
MKKSQLLLICFGIFIAVLSCSSPERKKVMTSGPEVVPFAVLPFSLTEVKLLDGPFLHATELGIKTLLNYEPDRLLAKFYIEAGLKPKAEHYMGWENEMRQATTGHYLSACSMMYQTTGDSCLKG